MKIVHISLGHNATASLFENGKCLAYLHEEKFNNIKNYWGFPNKCLDYLDQKFSLKNLDYIVFPSTQSFWSETVDTQKTYTTAIQKIGTSKIRNFTNWLEYKLKWKKFFFFIRSLILDKIISPSSRKALIKYLSDKYQLDPQKILFLDHHYCHALASVHFYNLHLKKTPTILFTLDGSGDNFCSKTYIYSPKKNRLKLISQSSYDTSIGLLYSGLTQFLGMKPLEHEYKVMGLAAYVSDEKYYQNILQEFKKNIYFDHQSLEFKSTFNLANSHLFFKEKFVGCRFDNLAAAAQKLTEDLVLDWIKTVTQKYKIYNIACSGGVFMNVKLNQKIQDEKYLKKIYFMPSAGDESLGYGAVFNLFMKHKITPISDMSMYQGLSYTNEEISKYLQSKKIIHQFNLQKIDNIEEKIAQLLTDGEIVSWFNSKGEWGARSLCNRTILANASKYSSYQEINDAIKMRDFWMPFAPTILDNWAPKYISHWSSYKNKVEQSSKYMITAFNTTPLAQQHLVAAIHQKDKTIRPQIVNDQDNPSLYKMLKIFSQKTGMGGVLNTSLNIHGYPLVGTLDQAIFTLKNSKLKYLVVGDYLISKKI